MSPRPVTPSDPNDSVRETDAEGHELLPSGPHKQQKNLSPKEDSPRPSQLSTTWRDYWKTPAAMAALFLLAWIIAIIHLALFLSLDKKRTNGPGSTPQSYVAALSHLLGLLFRTALCGSLAVAFTQYLWRLMRIKTVKVSSIELLFKITQNPFLLALPEVVKTAPTLFILASFTWLLPIAVTFPPGALIVVSNLAQSSYNATVPTYNASSMGNNSQADSALKSLAIRHLGGGEWGYLGATPNVRRTGRLVLELDNIIPSSSPCGPNCTYDIQFEGPYLRCTDTIFNRTSATGPTDVCGFNAFSATNVSTLASSGLYNVGVAFSMSASRSIKLIPQGNSTVFFDDLQEIESISCIPSWASYAVNVTYSGGLRTITRSEKYMGSIRNMMIPVTQYTPATPECDQLWANYTKDPAAFEACLQYTPAVWPQPLLQTFTAFNHFSLIDALVSPLSGNYTMLPSGSFTGGGSTGITCGPTGGTLVADTRLNTQRDNFARSATDGPSFAVSQGILNDALFNIIMSAALQLGFWYTTVPVNITNIQEVYSFISPKTLIIPYLTCLLLSIPFLCLGLNSLRLNGVSAIEGGFLQILMTTTGSKALEKAAAGGCLGGDENVPENLKRMRIRFGELVWSRVDEDGDRGVVKRAGFGTDDEVMPLRRAVAYGV